MGPTRYIGMMIGMTTTKIAITMPAETLRRARAAVSRGHARSLSAYLSLAVEQKTMLDDLDVLLATMLEESGGPLTAAEKRRANRALDGQPTARRSRR